MKKFKLYYLNDPQEETISKTTSPSLQKAISFFSQTKKLSLESFLQIFRVKEIK
jgi:hypothetical protein